MVFEEGDFLILQPTNWEKLESESEMQVPTSMRGYCGLSNSLKTNYGMIVQRDIVINILK